MLFLLITEEKMKNWLMLLTGESKKWEAGKGEQVGPSKETTD